MNIHSIKTLIEDFSIEELKAAEGAFEQGLPVAIDVPGTDEGEQFTHVIAAIWVKSEMDTKKVDYRTALRAYTGKVRASIS